MGGAALIGDDAGIFAAGGAALGGGEPAFETGPTAGTTRADGGAAIGRAAAPVLLGSPGDGRSCGPAGFAPGAPGAPWAPGLIGGLKPGAAIAIVFGSGGIDGGFGDEPGGTFGELAGPTFGELGVPAGIAAEDGAPRVAAVAAGWIPTMVAFFPAIGRICGAFARGSAPPVAPGGRAAGDIARGGGETAGGAAAGGGARGGAACAAGLGSLGLRTLTGGAETETGPMSGAPPAATFDTLTGFATLGRDDDDDGCPEAIAPDAEGAGAALPDETAIDPEAEGVAVAQMPPVFACAIGPFF